MKSLFRDRAVFLDLDIPQISCAGSTVGLMKFRGESAGNHLPKRGEGGPFCVGKQICRLPDWWTRLVKAGQPKSFASRWRTDS